MQGCYIKNKLKTDADITRRQIEEIHNFLLYLLE